NVFICRDCAEICIGVFSSYDPEWRDLQIARLANGGFSAKTETIYVWLPEEGVDVWRPVTAQPVHDYLYRLIDAQPEGEVWESSRATPSGVAAASCRATRERSPTIWSPLKTGHASH